MNRSILLIPFLFTSCVEFDPAIHDPVYRAHSPNPNDRCEIQDYTFFQWADDIYLGDAVIEGLPIEEGPEALIDFCKRKIFNLGYEIKKKPEDLDLDFWSRATALPGVIWVPANIDDRVPFHQAGTYCHEYVHARTYTRLGFERSINMYASSSHSRIAFEMPAFTLSFYIYWMFVPHDDLNFKAHVEYVQRVAEKSYNGYALYDFSQECSRSMVLEYYYTRHLVPMEKAMREGVIPVFGEAVSG